MAELVLHGPKMKSSIEMTTLGEFMFNRSDKFKSNICQVDANKKKTESYSSVKQRSVKLAVALKNKLAPGDVVLTCSKNTLDAVIPIIASFYLGAIVANLDASLGVRMSRNLISLVTPKIIFVEEASVAMIEESLQETNLHPEIVVLGSSTKYQTFSALVRPSPKEKSFRPVKVGIHQTAAMFFSSGSSGFPKAICHSHYSLLQVVDIARKCEYVEDVVLYFGTFYWISSTIFLTLAFVDGSTRVFCDNTDGQTILQIIQDYKVSSIFGPPLLTYNITRVANLSQYDISSFSYMIITGTPFSPEEYTHFNDLLPNVDIIFSYGMTEIGHIALFNPKYDRELMKSKHKSCGKVIPETSLKVVNVDTDENLGPNQQGELRVKSPSLMTGYYKSDNSGQFDKDGFLKTQDLGYYDEDRCIYVVGRMREMFRYFGWQIIPSVIEAALLEFPAVKEAVVFAVPLETEEKGAIPGALVVLAEGFSVKTEEIQDFVAQHVAEREQLKGGVMIVKEIPKTPTGKAIRKEAQEYFLASLKK
ncbi:hypothetical protein MTP99_008481 [Tenebrio molitor]|nr:hypothetical protein MTP99_008481 [Tenebrio molitor]